MKIITGRITSTNAMVMTIGESKSSISNSTAVRIIRCKIVASNLLSISLLYGFMVTCKKSTTPQTVITAVLHNWQQNHW